MKQLNAKQKKFLKKLGADQATLVQIGKEGLSDNALNHISETLQNNELIKIRVLKNSAEEIQAVIDKFVEIFDVNVLKITGKTALIYKENLKKEDKIILP